MRFKHAFAAIGAVVRDSITVFLATYRLVVAALAFIGTFVVFATAAHAAPAVVAHLQPIPWGEYAAELLTASAGLLTTIVTFLVAKYVPAVYRLFLTPQVIADAVHLAIATTAGAVKGQTVSVQTTNLLLAQAEAIVVKEAPVVAKWLGVQLMPRILAYLSKEGMVPADADSDSLALHRTL